MTRPPFVRHEWADPKPILAGAVDELPATLATFAGPDTPAVLAAEPRLGDLADIVLGCARCGGVPDDVWAGVQRITGALLGPARTVTLATAPNAATPVVLSALRGEVTRRRFLEALRRASDELAERP